MATTDPAGPGPSRSGAARPGFARRRFSETKAAFKTTEFIAYVAVLIGILIAGAVIDADDDQADLFTGDKVWLYVALLTIGYMVSRGLAKSGTGEPYGADGDDR